MHSMHFLAVAAGGIRTALFSSGPFTIPCVWGLLNYQELQHIASSVEFFTFFGASFVGLVLLRIFRIFCFKAQVAAKAWETGRFRGTREVRRRRPR